MIVTDAAAHAFLVGYVRGRGEQMWETDGCTPFSSERDEWERLALATLESVRNMTPEQMRGIAAIFGGKVIEEGT